MAHPTPLRAPRIRRAGIPDAAVLVVRGDDAEVDDLAADQLERFPVLAVFEMASLVEAGFEVVPTFRTPHVTVAFAGDLDQHLVVLTRLEPRVVENPHHDREPGE